MFKQEIYEEKMTLNKMNDGVGKKIVEALKMQPEDFSENESFESEEEQRFDNPVMTDPSDAMLIDSESSDFDTSNEDNFGNSVPHVSDTPNNTSNMQLKIQSQLREAQYQHEPSSSFVDSAFQQSLAQNLGFAPMQDDFEYPVNVAVLKQLIGKLPAGVSKQTGAIIIKQTMEALGISMKTVIQEAQQVQETLANNARECQANIVEYRKQIGLLESKSQQYQRQSAVMNDIISLFIHTGNRK